MTGLEKPWYTSTFDTFLGVDVPRLTGLPRQRFARDFSTLERRLTTEGESFLTKTLPSLGKAIDLALQGACPLATLAFKKRPRSALPAFLQALLERVFLNSGWVRDEPCVTSIYCLRQLCYWCKKIEKGYSDESLQQTAADFKEVDSELPELEYRFDGRVIGTARAIIESIFAHRARMDTIRPSHGPGAVATGEGVVGKRVFKRCYTDLESVFRPIPTFFSLRDASENLDLILGRFQTKYGLSRTEFVEKDSSGPRTIGLEPSEYQWCQQAVKNFLYSFIETHRTTRGQVNFTDQSINRNLTAKWADFDTLDMSKASDRNSYALVASLFERTWIWPYLRASRTPGTVLPSGQVLMFKKFAPMGSATCFPVQALVYFALAIAVLHVKGGIPLGLARRSVFVYGDDLVVPHGTWAILYDSFRDFGLVFNESKCCTHGKFRESCGMDAYDGVDVTPVRMRKVYPGRSATDLIPVVRHANSLAERGLWASSLTFRELALEKFPLLKELRLPISSRKDLPILYWFSIPEAETIHYHTKDGITRIKGWYYRPKGLVASDDVERFCLRESLSRGGPVGSLRCSPGSVVRVIGAKYSGELRKKKFVVVREYSMTRE